VTCEDEVFEKNGFQFRRAKTLRIMPRHVEWARSLFFWMLDEVKDVYEEIDIKSDKAATFLTTEKAYSAIEYIKQVGSISWRDLARRRNFAVKHQQEFLKACADYGVIIKETIHPVNKRKVLSFEYKGE
jgi:hypothetical protein